MIRESSDPASVLCARLQEKIDFLDEMTARVRGDQIVNLDGLNDDVTSLCEQIEASTPEIAHRTEQKMAEMIGKLETLAGELQSLRLRLVPQAGDNRSRH